jgi:hypothetical protein
LFSFLEGGALRRGKLLAPFLLFNTNQQVPARMFKAKPFIHLVCLLEYKFTQQP